MSKHQVYFYVFHGYKGRGDLKFNDLLFKVGRSRGSKKDQRLIDNTKREGKFAWIKLWDTVNPIANKIFEDEWSAAEYEQKLHKMLGCKDFFIPEKVSGITEFRLGSQERFDILEKEFNL